MKKIQLSLFTILLSFSAWAYDVEIDGIFYNLNDDTKEASVTYQTELYNSYSGDVCIPSVIDYSEKTYTVTSIGDYAFSECNGLTSIEIPSSVTSINRWAFYDCVNLSSIEIPYGITIIDESAFADCTGITSLKLSSSIKTIGKGSFQHCSRISSLVIPEGVESISERAFCNCYGLSSVEISNSVKTLGKACFAMNSYEPKLENVIIGSGVETIGERAFKGCNIMTSIIIPDGVKIIGDNAFDGCLNLEELSLGKNVEVLGDNVFVNCDNLKTIMLNSNHILSAEYSNDKSLKDIFGTQVIQYKLGDEITAIGNYAFCGCISLRNVIIGKNTTTIGECSFKGCTFIRSVEIPSNVVNVGFGAFSDCTYLNVVNISDLSAWCKISFGFTESSNPLFYAHNLYINNIRRDEIIIPDDVNIINDMAFVGCSMESVKISKAVESIGRYSFSNCKNLKKIEISENVTHIRDYAFLEDESLQEVYCYAKNIPINNHTIFNASNYKNATLYVPKSSLEKYKSTLPWSDFKYIEPISEVYSITYLVDGEIYKSYELAEGETIIPEKEPAKEGCTFSGWSDIPATMPAEDVTIEGTFTLIKDNIVFADEKVKSICVNNWDTDDDGELSKEEAAAVNSLGYVFSGNQDIVSFDELQYFVGLSVIGTGCFMNCTNLNSISIPSGVMKIEDLAFDYCTSLTSVHIHNLEAWCQITFDKESSNPLYYAHNLFLNGTLLEDLVIPNSIESIKPFAFRNCTSICTLSFNNIVTSIGNNAFDGCSNIKNLDIPDNMITINAYAFRGCSNITTLRLSDGLNEISNSAFSGCSSLKQVELPNHITNIGNTAFSMCNELVSVSIPADVTNIGKGAFNSCRNLTSITIHATTPPKCGNNVFSGVNKENCYLFVTEGTVGNYKNADQWKDFTNILPIGSGISYAIAIADEITNGTIKVNPTSAAEGETITLTITPDAGYELATLTITGATSGEEIEYDSWEYTFLMPAEPVNINATFQEAYVKLSDYAVETDGEIDDEGQVKILATFTAETKGSYEEMFFGDIMFDYVILNNAGTTVSTGQLMGSVLDMPAYWYVDDLEEGTEYTVNLTAVHVIDYITSEEIFTEVAEAGSVLATAQFTTSSPSDVKAPITADGVKPNGKYLEKGKIVIWQDGTKFTTSGTIAR